MKTQISERSDGKGNFYVSGSEIEDGDIRVSFVEGNVIAWRDFSLVDAMLLRDMLDEAVKELFEVDPPRRCPCCGYTRTDAELYGDHKLCRRYPFFPGETGQSEAVMV